MREKVTVATLVTTLLMLSVNRVLGHPVYVYGLSALKLNVLSLLPSKNKYYFACACLKFSDGRIVIFFQIIGCRISGQYYPSDLGSDIGCVAGIVHLLLHPAPLLRKASITH